MPETISIEVACATVERQIVLELEVIPGTTLSSALTKSGILDAFPELSVEILQFGVYGLRQRGDYVLQKGDRVEIYRPLLVSPTEARRLRAKAEKEA